MDKRREFMTELANDAIRAAKDALMRNMQVHDGDVTKLAIALIEAEQKERKS